MIREESICQNQIEIIASAIEDAQTIGVSKELTFRSKAPHFWHFEIKVSPSPEDLIKIMKQAVRLMKFFRSGDQVWASSMSLFEKTLLVLEKRDQL